MKHLLSIADLSRDDPTQHLKYRPPSRPQQQFPLGLSDMSFSVPSAWVIRELDPGIYRHLDCKASAVIRGHGPTRPMSSAALVPALADHCQEVTVLGSFPIAELAE